MEVVKKQQEKIKAMINFPGKDLQVFIVTGLIKNGMQTLNQLPHKTAGKTQPSGV